MWGASARLALTSAMKFKTGLPPPFYSLALWLRGHTISKLISAPKTQGAAIRNRIRSSIHERKLSLGATDEDGEEHSFLVFH